MAVSIQQAALNALAKYLTAQLQVPPYFSEIVVNAYWPEPDVPLPRRVITLTCSGPRITEIDGEQMLQVVSSAPINGTTTSKMFTWSVAALRQPIQMDVWATRETERDDILAQLDTVLRSSAAATLGVANSNPFRDGVVVPLADGYVGTADIMLENTSNLDGSEGAARQEWRSTLRGEASVILTLTAASPVLAQLKLVALLKENATPSTTDSYQSNADGSVTWTEP